MCFLLTAALVFQTLLGNAAGEEQKSYDNFFQWNYTIYLFENYTYDYAPENSTDYYSPEYDTDDYTVLESTIGKDLTDSAGSSLQGHLPFFFVLLHLLCFLLQQFTLLL